MIKKITLTIISLLLVSVIIIGFNFHSFVEGYQNGFYPMQTSFQTFAAYVGNIAYYVGNIF